MRSTTLRLALPLLAALALAGCKKEGTEGPLTACRPVSSPCALDSDCCSYGCMYGSCIPNPLEAGICRTSDDCSGRVCVEQRCTSSVSCLNPPDTCDARIPCCSGLCNAGICKADQAPVAVAGPVFSTPPPYRIAIQLTNGSYDPDTSSSSGLSYAWTVVSAPLGSTATFTPSAAYPTPTFTPDLVGTYQIRLRATNAGGSGEDTLTVDAVNTPPVVQMPADVASPAYQSRNVALTFSATVSDADGGPVTCSWTKTSPSNVTTEVSGPTACAGASGTAATGLSTVTLVEDEPGTWKLTLTATDGVNQVVKDRFVNVQNDPPVASAGPKRWGNFNLGGIPLNGTATDVNGDVLNGNQGDGLFTWEWRVTVAPAGSGQLATVVGTTPSVSFTPDAEGLYTLTLTADDGHGGPNGDSATSAVDVQVEPFVLPLGEVVDAEYVEGASPERLVVVQTDAGNAFKLTILNPATLTRIGDDVVLAARPIALALNFTAPAQSEAIVAEAGGIFQRITGIQSTPTVANTVPAGSELPADLVDVVHAGSNAYGLTASGTVYLLDPVGTSGAWWKAISCPGCATTPVGTRVAGGMTGGGTTPTIWLMQGGAPGRLGRYDIQPSNGNLISPVTRDDGTFSGATGVWLSFDGADVYTTRTSVCDALSSTLAQRVTTNLPYAPDHLDTTGALTGAIAQYGSSSLQPFSRSSVGGAFTSGTAKAFPFLGVNGNQVTNYGRFAFVKSGGGGYYAVVRANAGTAAAPVWRWGAVNLGP